MPFYYEIEEESAAGRRTANRLIALRKYLTEKLPRRDLNDHLLLATWNIREFDSTKYGERTQESYQYLAEIVSHFDLVAIQEVREDLSALEKLQETLGDWWKYIVTDVTEGRPGNRERMAFLFDGRKVRHGKVAGEVVIPDQKVGKRKYSPVRQLARTPFLCAFGSGWSKFMLCTVHILYGESKRDHPGRVKEIRLLAEFLAARANQETAWSNNMILLGDFNIFDPGDVTMKAIRDAGFEVPQRLQHVPGSNVAGNRHYDQIAFISRRHQLQFTESAGVLNFYDVVYREEDEAEYAEEMREKYLRKKTGAARSEKEKTRHYKAWRTYQMSDHLPMWVQLKVDFGEDYLRAKSRMR